MEEEAKNKKEQEHVGAIKNIISALSDEEDDKYPTDRMTLLTHKERKPSQRKCILESVSQNSAGVFIHCLLSHIKAKLRFGS